MTQKVIQLWDGKWYRVEDHYLHECCDCGLVHDVDLKLENGTVFTRWKVNKRETKLARKMAEKAKRAKTPDHP